MAPVGFEPTISASERPQNYALDRATTGTSAMYQWATFYAWIFVDFLYTTMPYEH